MSIIDLALDIINAVESFVERAKQFFYSVMLLGYRCPKCNSRLVMIAEGRCRCISCGLQFDPTVAFQRCLTCGGTPILRVSRYQCRKCYSDIRSKFLFDGLVFDTEYFRQKMAESRQRKKELKERISKMLAECRSADLPLQGIELSAVPGLVEALNSLTVGISENFEIESKDEFNLNRYEGHIQAHIQNFPITLKEIPPLSQENARKDLIWRFIAIIFLAHAGIIDLWQDGQDILVMKHEANRKGQDIFGESEESDGIEGFVGGVETW